MKILIITGLSGAGKSQAVHSLEDIGYYCIDNMPPTLIPKFAQLCYASAGKMDKAAIVCDIRGGDMFGELAAALDELADSGYDYEILFLEADNSALVKRYKESRRKHPLNQDNRLVDAIAKEREILSDIRTRARYIIDTTNKSQAMLKAEVAGLFSEAAPDRSMVINVLSFGFKNGIPLDADLVFDVRFLPNPYYIDTLREQTGMDKPVSDYVMQFEQSRAFLQKLCDMMAFLVPYYIEEGKSQLVVAIGCTGGHHRSVTIANALTSFLKESNYRAFVTHRDCPNTRGNAHA